MVSDKFMRNRVINFRRKSKEKYQLRTLHFIHKNSAIRSESKKEDENFTLPA